MENVPFSDVRFLFVDDRFEITRPYLKKIEANGGTVEYCTSIKQAYEYLSSREYDFVILDLHMHLPDPLPEALKEFADFFRLEKKLISEKRSLNTGQILGMYINKYLKNKVKFLYLSAVGAHYESLSGGEPTGQNICYDKYKVSPSEFLQIVATLVFDKQN